MRRVLLAGVAIIAWLGAFVGTRVYSLDADIVPWRIGQYSGIDEFMYSVAGFNLANHGAWSYKPLSYVTDDSTPLNVLQNLVTGATLSVFGNNFYGLRMSSVFLGLGCALLMGVIALHVLRAARDRGLISEPRAWMIAGFWALIVLLDFAFLLATRISEPTISRTFASLLVLAALTSRSALPDPKRVWGTMGIGFLACAAVLWVYLYNIFLVPTVVLVVLWRFRTDLKAAVAQLLALLVGGVIAAASYFGWVWLTYQQSPAAWYSFWIAAYATERSPGHGADRWLFDTNMFRFDRPLQVLVLGSIPIVIWALRRERLRPETPIVAMTAMAVAQSVVVFDYGLRKGVAFLPLFVLCGVVASVHLTGFVDWLAERGRRILAMAAYGLGCIVLGAWLLPLGLDRDWSGDFTLLPWMVSMNVKLGLIALLAVAIVLASRARGPLFLGATVILLVTVLIPSLRFDSRYIIERRTFTWRTLNKEVAALEGDAVLAGGWSYAVRLYGDVEPCEGNYLYGENRDSHMRILERVFDRGDANACYYFANSRPRGEMRSIGLELERRFPEVDLPRLLVLGRYTPGSPPASIEATATP